MIIAPVLSALFGTSASDPGSPPFSARRAALESSAGGGVAMTSTATTSVPQRDRVSDEAPVVADLALMATVGADLGRDDVVALPAAAVQPLPPPPPAPPPPGPAEPANRRRSQVGQASWYQIHNGTCAHVRLPKGTMVRVVNVANGKEVTCRVADRGPFLGGRIIDLDREGFAQIDSTTQGVIDVRIFW